MFEKRRKKQPSGQTLLSYFNKVEVSKPAKIQASFETLENRCFCESAESVSSADTWDDDDAISNADECLTGLWYEDYRPCNLDEAVFHKDVVKIIHQLIRIMGSKTMGVFSKVHSIEIFGHSGCGKTLLARLLADACGCEFREIGLADMTVEEFHTEI